MSISMPSRSSVTAGGGDGFVVEPTLHATVQASVEGGPYQVLPGRPQPLGATPDAHGVNFSLYCGAATAVELLLFAGDGVEPVQTIELDAEKHRTFLFWHAYVLGARPGLQYAYRVAGPRDLHGEGYRYDPDKILIDPYARGNDTTRWRRMSASRPGDNLADAMRSVVIDLEEYDWEGDQPLMRPLQDTIIYELHVAGFTKSPSSGCRHPGTFAGLIEKIPYLRELGITAVELLPVCQFDTQEIERVNPLDGRSLTNYWGYNTIAFFSPHHAYCVSPDHAAHIREFRDMVKALHRAGIEVILDMVFNHTGEGAHDGPTISFKGLDNTAYYYLRADDRQHYQDYSGCGNTMQCNQPIAQKLILECLEFWVREMHVDGFRFDEATIFARGEDGAPLTTPPVIWAIDLAASMAGTKLIAEAWDAGGLYAVGRFPGHHWAEWNDRFRNDIRRFVRGDPGMIGAVAQRITGSADLYEAGDKLPTNGVNFVTCHDGFTLNDLVSYNEKHNEANGEENRDGMSGGGNLSWNCGVEGATADPAIDALRARQIKNFFAMLLLAQGVPMILAGDEVRRTQGGNNNAYCQDNEVSWFDWTLVAREHALFRFVAQLIAFRKRHPTLRRRRFFTGRPTVKGQPDIAWHGRRLGKPGWSEPEARVLAYTLGATADDTAIHVMINMDDGDHAFEVPRAPGSTRWCRVIDTARAAPDDCMEAGDAPIWTLTAYRVQQRSVVVLVAEDR